VTPVELSFVLAVGLAGWCLWRWLTRSGLTPLREDDTSRHGVLLFVVAMVFCTLLQRQALGTQDVEALPLRGLVGIQAMSYLVGVALMVFAASRFGVRPASLGLRRHHGPSAPLVAAAGWMSYVPLLFAASLLNQALAPGLYGGEVPDSQIQLLLFLSEEGAARDPWVWIGMAIIIPIAEEVIFRGALFGGLRRILPTGAAVLLSAVIFGALHEKMVMLPVMIIGILLAKLYERTGSLLVPCLAHGLVNALTLALGLISTLPSEPSG
jgi:membrane protease YdiL (CAAX protease family)